MGRAILILMPHSSVDCSSVLLLSMADCLTFVMNGITISKTEGSCCSGFKSVKENPKSLCEAFNNNDNLGVPLNMTKATTLPAARGVSTPPLSKCGSN
ncbi:hypothetical protein AAC387_Pa06g2082 [Persea americana]